MVIRLARLLVLTAAAGSALPGPGSGETADLPTYVNPLPVVAGGESVESCADPSVVEGQGAGWAMYCTTDPLSGQDRGPSGRLVFHLIPMFRSDDLVHWSHAGDAFDRDPATATPPPPAWAAPSALFWAPEGEEIGGRSYLFFGVTDVREEAGGEPGCASDGAIGHAVADGPLGPWAAADAPLIAPRRGGEGCEFLWTYDPEVIATPDGRLFIYYGSYYGGLEVRELRVGPEGSLSADPGTAVPVALPDRYEGAEVVRAEGAYWLFASASNCCNGPQTGYGVFVGRSEEPTGPFLDREGQSFLDPRVGGTPVLVQNGNGWVGPGHNTVVRDRAGAWWTLYHAVEEAAPYFAGEVGFTRRPVLLDRLDWVDGWPQVTGGPSAEPRPAPALEAGAVPPPASGPVEAEVESASEVADEFDGPRLDLAWTWLREPPPGDVRLEDGVLEVAIRDTDLHEESDDAPVLLREAPGGDYLLETRVAIDLPPEGCCHNFVQAGLGVHGDDDNYLKLVVVSIWETRQTEFAREVGPVPAGFPRYGSSVGAPPGEDWTWLRIEVREGQGGESYTAFTSPDGESWTQGSTWTHSLGEDARIGLLAMGGPGGFTARFDRVRVVPLAD